MKNIYIYYLIVIILVCINNYHYATYSNLLFIKNIDESNFSYEVSSSIALTNEQLI